jgi:arginine decarboxylase
LASWKASDSADLYQIDAWGRGYFTINDKGHVVVRPKGRKGPGCDLFDLVRRLQRQGISSPVLFRFDDMIRDRVRTIEQAFLEAIREADYNGSYRLAYPVKVNPQYHVVETVRRAGTINPLAVEVGSKSELLAVMAIHDQPGALLICNGYKDSEYLELAMLAAKLGRRVIVVIEQLDEVELVLRLHERLGVDLTLGVRMKPISKGAGRWDESAGEKAKFGLTALEIIRAVELLHAADKRDWLKLLHYHVGSQITSIRAVTRVLREATRVYTELAALCPSMCMFNAGGGLGVDYDGSRTSFHSSMNYSVAEYATEIVYELMERCKETGVPQPDIITESGRATVAQHAVLVVEATDMLRGVGPSNGIGDVPTEHPLLKGLVELYEGLTVKNCRETLHEAMVIRDDVLEQFVRGDLSLADRGHAERALRLLIAKLHGLADQLKRPLEELKRLEPELYDICFCNFSVFQSIPDSWAIDQLFPIMPIHRLREEPTRDAVLADLTCDSDGKVDRFIDVRGVRRALRLHAVVPKQPYHLGVFLIGAYQEILGDLHNLFGDTNAVHVALDPDGHPRFKSVVRGDSMREVLTYVQYSPSELFERLQSASENALLAGRISEDEAHAIDRRYREALDGYTYLVTEDDAYAFEVEPGVPDLQDIGVTGRPTGTAPAPAASRSAGPRRTP